MAAWHDAAGSGAVMRQALPPSILDDASFRVLLGHDAEGPACRSIAVGSESDFGIYAVGTVERARMHGFGTAVTWAAIEAGRRAWGLDAVALQSSEMAVGVYSKMGFVEVCRYVEYQAPTGVPVA
jgi:predicted GNAT family N-acyltransferase